MEIKDSSSIPMSSVTINDLYKAFGAADCVVLKKYISSLSAAPCISLNKEIRQVPVGDNVALYRVAQIVYDKNENVQDKLTTVYSTAFSLQNCGLVMMLCGHKNRVDLFLGLATRTYEDRGGKILHINDMELSAECHTLESSFVANFPGSKLNPVGNNTKNCADVLYVDQLGKADIIQNAFKNVEYIAAVSSIPAIRNEKENKSIEFVQGLEKLIDTLRGKEYTALIIADTVGNDKIEEMCAEYEDIYSQLAPFRSSSQIINKQRSSATTESFVKGITDTTNETISKSLTHGTSIVKTHTDSGGISNGILYEHAYSRSKGENNAQTNTTARGTAKSLTEQNSVAKALTETSGESLQINYENRAVKALLDRLDEEIKRMRRCEDFGMFDTCAYFAAKDYDVAIAAASAFKSITRGENSSVEASAINVWGLNDSGAKNVVPSIKEYLMRFLHPIFYTEIDDQHRYQTTATMLISGQEMAYQMPMPKKSVTGISVVECAEFGREVISMASAEEGQLAIGNIYHMHAVEETPVNLDIQSLTAHTFITGSTGTGKSTTIYKLLDEISSSGSTDGKGENVKFMVVEPAKGEYKNILSANQNFDLRVYGTNPKLTKLLRINPFRFPSDKIHIYEHLDRLTEIFNVCWPMYAAMPAVLKAAMENAYRSAGWDLTRSANRHGEIYPCFADVAHEVERYINKSAYSDENKSNYKGSLLTRLESLTNGVNSLIFTADDLSDEELFDENVIVDLSRVGSSETKTLIMGILVLKLQEHRMATSDGSNAPLRHITVLEEAHTLLKRTSTEQSSESANLLGKSVEMLANSIAEMRTYGEGFIIADQSPGLLDMSVIRNTNTKIIMRLPDQSDRELVGKAANLNDDQITELAKLPRGVTAVYQSDWINPVLCKVGMPKFTQVKKSAFAEQDACPLLRNANILFDVMSEFSFRETLDDSAHRRELEETVLRSTMPTSIKVKLVDCLKAPSSSARTEQFAAAVFDSFENAKDALEQTTQDLSVENLKLAIMAELRPSIVVCSDEPIDCLLTLLISEYIERYHVEYPVWREFAEHIAGGDVV